MRKEETFSGWEATFFTASHADAGSWLSRSAVVVAGGMLAWLEGEWLRLCRDFPEVEFDEAVFKRELVAGVQELNELRARVTDLEREAELVELFQVGGGEHASALRAEAARLRAAAPNPRLSAICSSMRRIRRSASPPVGQPGASGQPRASHPVAVLERLF